MEESFIKRGSYATLMVKEIAIGLLYLPHITMYIFVV
jgi:hypothetical protein